MMRALAACIGLLVASPTLAAVEWQAKVDPWVLSRATLESEAEFLVFFQEQADLENASSAGNDRLDRIRWVVDRLRGVADSTQGPLRTELERTGVPYRAFWVANMLWVRGDLATIESIARRPEVHRLHANPRVELQLPDPPTVETFESAQGIEPNLVQIGAPQFWAAGYTGQGVVVAGQDTGYQWDHPALRQQYRGWNGTTADHDYNWHDAIHAPGSDCGSDSPVPCDDGHHGTHTMGTMIGDDGGSNQIGVAPGARWIGCRNMDEGFGTPASYSECFQWFLAPTRVDGTEPDPSQAPHVINNSWVCPPSEGCGDPEVLRTVVENVRAAGILVVASAGNSGSACSSINQPPAIYDKAFTVGAVQDNDAIAIFSSRGGVAIDGSNRLKPDVAAPGVGIRSSRNNDGYGSMSGTSMAGPHVAGQVALLISAVPVLAGRPEVLESCIEATATPLTTDQSCSGIPGSQVPNNTFGRGRIELALPLPLECSSAFIFADDFEAGAPSDWPHASE